MKNSFERLYNSFSDNRINAYLTEIDFTKYHFIAIVLLFSLTYYIGFYVWN